MVVLVGISLPTPATQEKKVAPRSVAMETTRYRKYKTNKTIEKKTKTKQNKTDLDR